MRPPHLAPLALALPACTAADANLSTWTILILAALPIGMPLYYLARGKIEDWLSLAEHAVTEERNADLSVSAGAHDAAGYARARAGRCVAAIPRPLRGRLLARARRLAGAALLCLVLGGCNTVAEHRELRIGECRRTCAPNGWALSTWNGGCTCYGPGATDGGAQ